MKTTRVGLKLYVGRCPLQKGLGELYEVCSICLSRSILMDLGTSIAILASRTKVRQAGMAIDKGDGLPAITPGGGARSRHTVTGSHVRSAYELCAHAAGASSRPCHERDITLAIRAAIPDFVRDTIRSNPPFQLVRTALHQRRGPIAGQCWFHEFRLTSYRLAAAASRPWRDGSSRTHGRSRCSRERYQPNHRSDAPLQLERTIR
jgi:hypothetical protein